MKYVTTDLTKWGAGLGVVLQPGDIDNNFWELRSALNDLLANIPAGVGIFSITQNADKSIQFNMTNGTTIGPIQWPTTEFHDRGDWQPNTFYGVLDIVRQAGVGLYKVNLSHISGTAFNGSATDSNGNLLYLQMFAFQAPENIVYDIGFGYSGVLKDIPTSIDRIWEEPIVRKILLPVMPAAGAYHRAYLRVAPTTVAQSWTLYQNSTAIGTLACAIGSNAPAIVITADVTFNPTTDRIGLGRQATDDAVAGGLSLVLAAQQVLG